MSSPTQFAIPPMSAKALLVPHGHTLRITDIEGCQPGDLVAFNADDLSERFSQARTRVENRKVTATTGDALWSNAQPPKAMMTIAADTFGAHDLLYTPCCRYALEQRFGVSRPGCLEHLAEALAPWGIGLADVPDPLNLFFRVLVGPNGELRIGDAAWEPGDHIDLRAEIDCLVAVSTCSVPIAGRANTAFEVTLLR